MKKINFIPLGLLFISIFIFIGCDDDDDKKSSETTRVEVRLTDAPAPYDAVNINIQAVALHVNSDWVELDLLNPGIYDLLDFQNGIDTLLAGEDVPSGKISQIRFVLGENGNSVVKDGQTYPLKTPSAQQSGLKLNLHDDLMPNVTYRLWIDFDASRSIVETGSGDFQLKPVIRTYTEAMGGSLTGFVLPQEAKASVWAILGTDSILTYPRSDGYFLFAGLQPSTLWKVVFDADNATGYKDSVRTEISIIKGEVTDLETVTLTK